jgi:tRNA-(ms[2]io[6]A)-hydroxylase
MESRMPKLAVATDATWVEWAISHLDEVLLDHAHAEKKAAGMAVNLLFRYPDQHTLLMPLAALAREELSHFETMLGHLEARGIRFARQRPSPYAGRLQRIVRTYEPARLVDTLLCCAVIEARSSERFRLLAKALREREPELAALYEQLYEAEGRHHGAYLRLAREIVLGDELHTRLAEILEHEARVLAEGPHVPRLHN